MTTDFADSTGWPASPGGGTLQESPRLLVELAAHEVVGRRVADIEMNGIVEVDEFHEFISLRIVYVVGLLPLLLIIVQPIKC